MDISVFDVPDLFDHFVERERFIRDQKHSMEEKKKVMQNKTQKSLSDRGNECASALRLFFRFVELVIKPKIIDVRFLFEEKVVRTWTVFYSGYVSSPSTAGNNAKYLAQFYNYLLVSNRLASLHEL